MNGLLGVGLAVLAALMLAVQSLSVRVSSKTHTLVEVVGVMFAINLVVLIPIAGVSAYPTFSITLRALAAFTAAGVVGSLLARACYFIGISRLGASRTEPLKALLPLFAVITAVVILDERVTPVLGAGIAMLLIGGVAVTLESKTSPVTPTGRERWIALSYPLAAAVFLGIDPVLTKLGLAEGTSVMVGVAIRVTAAAVGFGVYLVWRSFRTVVQWQIRANRWVVVAAVANTAYLLAYYAALARTPVTVVTSVLGFSTLFVVVGAAVFLQGDERVTWRLVGAAAAVVIGVLLVVQS